MTLEGVSLLRSLAWSHVTLFSESPSSTPRTADYTAARSRPYAVKDTCWVPWLMKVKTSSTKPSRRSELQEHRGNGRVHVCFAAKSGGGGQNSHPATDCREPETRTALAIYSPEIPPQDEAPLAPTFPICSHLISFPGGGIRGGVLARPRRRLHTTLAHGHIIFPRCQPVVPVSPPPSVRKRESLC